MSSLSCLLMLFQCIMSSLSCRCCRFPNVQRCSKQYSVAVISVAAIHASIAVISALELAVISVAAIPVSVAVISALELAVYNVAVISTLVCSRFCPSTWQFLVSVAVFCVA